MSSKLTELTESSPSAPPRSVLCGSGVFSQLSSPSMASSGQFDPSQTYDGYRAVEILDPACTECLAKGKDCFQHYNPRSSKCHSCFIGKKPCRHAISGGIYGVERMGLLGKNSQSLRNLLLMELQDFLNVSDLHILIELVLIF
ncbi:hypothetical protein O181_113576 [Austropuccinia psidii MF-1]|uniref:Uncharacterized protein n=1 Tax=Austropuccinia psidii MF-1 TaxID=1389203 RepID=A0A9Q3PUK6_9BASI|nr:hypothetical protein [Austropuccinia psidii MF-1]